MSARSIAVAGIGFGALAIATFGLLEVAQSPVVAPPSVSGGGGRLTPWHTHATGNDPVSKYIEQQALQADDEEVILLLTQLMRVIP